MCVSPTPQSSTRFLDLHISHDICVCLEDLVTGCSVKIQVERFIEKSNRYGEVIRSTSRAQFIVCIKPGWKDGTKITYPQQGNQQYGCVPSDVVFFVRQKPHKDFIRNGDDLVYRHEVVLKKLSKPDNYELKITTLEGSQEAAPA